DDLPLLVPYLLKEIGAAESDRVQSAELIAELSRCSWPGNVRELRNHLERFLTFRDTGGAAPEPAAQAVTGSPSKVLAIREARDQFDRGYLEQLLAANSGNVSAAARMAGLDRAQLYRLLWRHKLR